jgi:hypothetical protein
MPLVPLPAGHRWGVVRPRSRPLCLLALAPHSAGRSASRSEEVEVHSRDRVEPTLPLRLASDVGPSGSALLRAGFALQWWTYRSSPRVWGLPRQCRGVATPSTSTFYHGPSAVVGRLEGVRTTTYPPFCCICTTGGPVCFVRRTRRGCQLLRSSSQLWKSRSEHLSCLMLTDKRCIHLRSASVRTYTFFTTGFPRFLSIHGARGLQAFDLLLLTNY